MMIPARQEQIYAIYFHDMTGEVKIWNFLRNLPTFVTSYESELHGLIYYSSLGQSWRAQFLGLHVAALTIAQ
jgi:hypothetical protein